MVRPKTRLTAQEIKIERTLRQAPMAGVPNTVFGMLMSQGIETIALKPTVAARFGAGSGLLVVYVNPQDCGVQRWSAIRRRD